MDDNSAEQFPYNLVTTRKRFLVTSPPADFFADDIPMLVADVTNWPTMGLSSGQVPQVGSTNWTMISRFPAPVNEVATWASQFRPCTGKSLSWIFPIRRQVLSAHFLLLPLPSFSKANKANYPQSSSILVGCSLINHPFRGYAPWHPMTMETPRSSQEILRRASISWNRVSAQSPRAFSEQTWTWFWGIIVPSADKIP